MADDDKSAAGYIRSLINAFLNINRGYFVIVL